MPVWSHVMQREKEEELIFRGLQYAEAIRVFQQRNGRYPISLEELNKVRPRAIRQLWEDPIGESGSWGLIHAKAAGRRQRGQGEGEEEQGQPRTVGGDERGLQTESRFPGARQQGGQPDDPLRAGPIVGVYSLADGTAIKTFFGSNSYSEWKFTVEMLPSPAPVPGSLNVPRAHSGWVGRPFREGLEPQQGGLPGGGQGPDAGRKTPRGDRQRGR